MTDAGLLAPLSTEFALVAADLSLASTLAFADAVVYASVGQHQAELVTSDGHFDGLPGVTCFAKKKKLEPSSE